jgi:hypothetical protein
VEEGAGGNEEVDKDDGEELKSLWSAASSKIRFRMILCNSKRIEEDAEAER